MDTGIPEDIFSHTGFDPQKLFLYVQGYNPPALGSIVQAPYSSVVQPMLPLVKRYFFLSKGSLFSLSQCGSYTGWRVQETSL